MADFSIKSSKNKGPFSLITQNLNTVLLTFNIFAFGIVIYLFFYPPFVNAKTLNSKIFDEVTKLITINKNEVPIIAEINDVNSIKTINSVMAEVYAKAQNGDYFIALSDRIIIYRRDTESIVYHGPSPAQIVESRKAQLISNIKNAAGTQSIAINVDETPQLLAAFDPVKLKEMDPTFYASIAENDVIAVFPVSEKIIIFRPANNTIINSGSYKSVISN